MDPLGHLHEECLVHVLDFCLERPEPRGSDFLDNIREDDQSETINTLHVAQAYSRVAPLNQKWRIFMDRWLNWIARDGLEVGGPTTAKIYECLGWMARQNLPLKSLDVNNRTYDLLAPPLRKNDTTRLVEARIDTSGCSWQGLQEILAEQCPNLRKLQLTISANAVQEWIAEMQVGSLGSKSENVPGISASLLAIPKSVDLRVQFPSVKYPPQYTKTVYELVSKLIPQMTSLENLCLQCRSGSGANATGKIRISSNTIQTLSLERFCPWNNTIVDLTQCPGVKEFTLCEGTFGKQQTLVGNQDDPRCRRVSVEETHEVWSKASETDVPECVQS